ncbi:hypothetical protein [Legionella bononiensis]|uniref:hypothetical protein n=1 Tax=Legionella bononiensis TaxID=2793102 RepID=UPI001EE3B7F5|nr:hypothetical protein [Legionella bononiensis]
MRLKSACEQRIKTCTRKNQNPLMETALFYVLLDTGLRESEVVNLNVDQYRQKGCAKCYVINQSVLVKKFLYHKKVGDI